jgi:aryl-alcohol dehydrogenase-like predicted oxidoreductase
LPSAFDRTLGAYRALEALLADGRVRAIGGSNFMLEHLDRLLAAFAATRSARSRALFLCSSCACWRMTTALQVSKPV